MLGSYERRTVSFWHSPEEPLSVEEVRLLR